MTYWDIIADTGRGLERVDIATNESESAEIVTALLNAGVLKIDVKVRRI